MMFPDIVGHKLDAAPPDFNVTRADQGENRVVRYRKFLRPRERFALAWDVLDAAQRDAVESHIAAVAGGLAFEWADWQPLFHLFVPVAIGDGTTTTFDVPGLDFEAADFFTGAGTAVAGSVTLGAGANGRPQVTISPAPGAGVPVWMNGTMRRIYGVRFAEDPQPLERDAETGTWSFATVLETTK